MTPLSAALNYALREWPVFPCRAEGERRKGPLIERGLHAATQDGATICDWWHRWPNALIGIPTGRASRFVALDIDVKSTVNGFDTLAQLGFAVLPDTPMVHTASGGLHLYFEPPQHIEIRNSNGERGSGIRRGLDWRGEGGYVIAPSPGSGYQWDPHQNLDTAPLAPLPAGLLPRHPRQRAATARPARSTAGLSPYAEAALDGACRSIIGAPAGEQETTLNTECFAIGTLAGAGAIPTDFALEALIWAARQIPDYDHQHPWRAHQIERKVEHAFEAGLRHPRETRRA
jgi:putative DNA primase/helicase